MSMKKKNWLNPSVQILALSKTAEGETEANVEFRTTDSVYQTITMDPAVMNMTACTGSSESVSES